MIVFDIFAASFILVFVDITSFLLRYLLVIYSDSWFREVEVF